MNKINISILGDSGCGKTTLIQKYCTNTFFDKPTSTIGLDYCKKEIHLDSTRIILDIYDTAGQERYRSMVKSYYRNSHGIILVFDITNYQSFVSLEDWIQEIRNNATNPYVEIILVGTKSDKGTQRAVNHDDISDFSIKYGLKYLETSSKNGININELFTLMAANITNKMQDTIKGPYFIISSSSHNTNKNYCPC